MKNKLYTDGGARGNPGPAAVGIAIFDDKDEIIIAGGKNIGVATNNFAEYTALLIGLEKARELKVTELDCFLDSELVVKQLNGQYQVKDMNLRELYKKVVLLKGDFSIISFNHVKRINNKLADKLVNEALDTNEDTI